MNHQLPALNYIQVSHRCDAVEYTIAGHCCPVEVVRQILEWQAFHGFIGRFGVVSI